MFERTRGAIEARLHRRVHRAGGRPPVQGRTGLSLRRVLRTLRRLRSATVEINGVITTIPPALGPEATAILNALQHPGGRH